ncbi:MAG: 50S ribosomal protein L10 [Lentisphaeria bacterium]|nr:50S ribosomal protein L10 [Lentisphaeria bacterium]
MRSEKIQMLEVVKGLMENKPVFIMGFNDLTVAEFSEFRAKLAGIGAEVHVVKNTLICKAAEVLGYDDLAKQNLSLASAVVSGSNDALAMAKAIKELSKTAIGEDKKSKVCFKAGYLEGKLQSAEDCNILADLPPREVLLGQLLGLLQAPAGQLARLINAYLEKKEQAA